MSLKCARCLFTLDNWSEWPAPICVEAPIADRLPPELDIIGCEIKTSYGSGGIVTAVSGPHMNEPEWYERAAMAGCFTIVYEDQSDKSRCWINQVYVKNGHIYSGPCKPEYAALPGQDEVFVIRQARPAQGSLFGTEVA